MGKAIRWLKGLFGMKKPESDTNTNTNCSQTTTNLRHHYPKNDKKGSSFGRSEGLCHNPATIPPNLSPAEAAWLRSFYSEDTTAAADKEQSRHAIAVAAATAAAADAAVVAAQAAAVVVRLTSHGRGRGAAATTHERWASLRIQTVFRGYLARKALRALKGLVKLQAVVRGYLVRKQATATLHSMQALIRAQATVRSHRNRCSLILNSNKFDPRARKSMDSNNSDSGDQLLHLHHSGQIPCHSRRLSASLDANYADETPKIVEVDTGRPKSRSRRTNTSMSDFGDDPIVPPAPVACYYQAMSSPLPCRRIAVPTPAPADCHYYYYCGNSREWGLTGDECRFSTAQSTPRFCGDCSSGQLAPPTPAKSVCGGADYGYSSGNCPNYMTSTKSFKAKLRSYSAPKQRPDPSPKKRLSLNDMMESRTSLSGVRMQRSCSQVQEPISFKNAVMGKLEYRDRTG